MERETGYEVEGTAGGQATAPSPGATRAGHPGNREQMTAALRAQMDGGTLKPGDVVSIVELIGAWAAARPRSPRQSRTSHARDASSATPDAGTSSRPAPAPGPTPPPAASAGTPSAVSTTPPNAAHQPAPCRKTPPAGNDRSHHHLPCRSSNQVTVRPHAATTPTARQGRRQAEAPARPPRHARPCA